MRSSPLPFLNLQHLCVFLAADVIIMNHFSLFQQFSVTDDGADGYLGPAQLSAVVHNQLKISGEREVSIKNSFLLLPAEFVKVKQETNGDFFAV